MSLFAELQRRNVIRVGIAYGVASWVLLQIVDVISPILELPEWAPKLILLILAIGLVPALIFAWAFEMTPEGIKREAEVDRSASIAGKTGKKLDRIIIATLAVAVVLLLADRQYNAPTEEAVAEVAGEDTAEAQEHKSIAVLPFVNMSSDEEQEYFSDGITEEILNSLAGVKELKVAGRTSSFAFKGQNDDLRRIGDALGVNHILEGSVRKSGDQVRITAQLIQVDNGFHLWSETYDRELIDVFAIQDEIANEILHQLRTALLADDVAIAEAQRTSPEVYELYLRAKQRIYTRIGSEIETAVRELDEAIQLDPDYAPAFAQRGIATMLLSDQQYGSIPNDESNRRGKRFADQALRLDPNLAEGWAALGLYYGRDGTENDMAVDVLVKALEINPNMIDASNWLQIALRGLGDLSGALEIVEEMVERDPLYRPAFGNAMFLFNAFNRQDKAEQMIERMTAFDPDNPDLLAAKAVNYMFSGRAGEALQLMEQVREVDEIDGIDRIYLSLGLLRTGQYERAAEEGSQFFQPDALYELGRKDEAFEMAYRQATSGNPGTYFYLLLRDGRDKDMIDFLEERWPSVTALADEHPGEDLGYDLMQNVALAYQRTGNHQRADEALTLVDQHLARLANQGIENFAFSFNQAVHAAMLGDTDLAFEHLFVAAEGGASSGGELAEVVPQLTNLVDDPRYAEIQEMMLATMNRDRTVAGLPPFDANYEVVAQTLDSSN